MPNRGSSLACLGKPAQSGLGRYDSLARTMVLPVPGLVASTSFATSFIGTLDATVMQTSSIARLATHESFNRLCRELSATRCSKQNPGVTTAINNPSLCRRSVHHKARNMPSYAPMARPRCHPLKHSVRSIHQGPGMKHRAFIALGSNLGDRVVMIEEACRRMDSTKHIRILRTSSLWDTKAMYVVDQDRFVNGVCEVIYSLCKFHVSLLWKG
jgi:hypothetical protein